MNFGFVLIIAVLIALTSQKNLRTVEKYLSEWEQYKVRTIVSIIKKAAFESIILN